jgi:hypothetical protein
MLRCSARTLRLALFLPLLAACAGIQKPLETTAALDPAKGYVAGRFARLSGSEFGLALYDERDVEFRVTFGARPATTKGIVPERGTAIDVTGITGLPPGDYRVGGWIAAGVRPLNANSPLGRPFRVEPGHVVFLGNFDAISTTWTSGTVTTTEWKLQPLAIKADEVAAVVRKAYPGFVDAPTECLLCYAPTAGATVYAMPTAKTSPTYGQRSTVLHFHRRSGKYDAWGLHAWETFQTPEDVRSTAATKDTRVLTGVTWDQPLPADGTDDFGAYWKLLDANFRNGRANFTIHSGTVTEFANRFWIVEDSREAWVNEGDPKVYLSREAAQAAWKK